MGEGDKERSLRHARLAGVWFFGTLAAAASMTGLFAGVVLLTGGTVTSDKLIEWGLINLFAWAFACFFIVKPHW